MLNFFIRMILIIKSYNTLYIEFSIKVYKH